MNRSTWNILWRCSFHMLICNYNSTFQQQVYCLQPVLLKREVNMCLSLYVYNVYFCSFFPSFSLYCLSILSFLSKYMLRVGVSIRKMIIEDIHMNNLPIKQSFSEQIRLYVHHRKVCRNIQLLSLVCSPVNTVISTVVQRK